MELRDDRKLNIKKKIKKYLFICNSFIVIILIIIFGSDVMSFELTHKAVLCWYFGVTVLSCFLAILNEFIRDLLELIFDKEEKKKK